ncbi:hypothetical protein BGZ50_003551 [Haplosporangium sp. Z 11]|nr:hypothetical protein BGZ50_003551 [Haplosporangium sp. Z 11]
MQRQFKELRHESTRLVDCKGAVAETGPSFISNSYCSWTTSPSQDLRDSAVSGSEQNPNAIIRPRTSTVKADASPISKTNPVQGRSHKRNPVATLPQRPSVTPSWSYRRFVKHVVLNFAHPEASPQMLIKVLECIGSRCQDQIQALDLYANEKMRAAGLESPAELERLFGSGFSKLRFLRLQGGFVDNQLLGALVKGLTPSPESACAQYEAVEFDPPFHPRSSAMPRLPQCQLSQVFLGPGSVTDSAIEKLIIAASHCLEVFSVTSCVDVSGGALASLLTRCPKLRVLSVHKSLASDKELFKGLGVEDDTSAPNPSHKTIIAPLERLELGTVKLTTAGVTEIIRGTCNTLRFLSLGPRYFKEDFLRDMVATMCSRLEEIHFDDPDRSLVQTQQLHQMPMQQPSSMSMPEGGQQPRRRFFSFGRNRRAIATEAQDEHPMRYQQQQQQEQANQTTNSHAHLQQIHNPHGVGSMQRRSAWLGEPSTEEWVLYGGCALWAASSSGMNAILKHHPGVIHLDGSGTRHSSRSSYRSSSRDLSTFFRDIGDHLKLLFPNRNNSGRDNHFLVPAGPVIAAQDLVPFSGHDNGFEGLLDRYEVYQSTIDTVLQSLQPSLKSFMVMQTDLILENARIHNIIDTTDIAAMDKKNIAQSYDAITVDRLETFLKLVVILGVLAFGAALALATAAQISFYSRAQ